MGRGRSFSPLEEELLRENYDKTIVELEEIFIENGYNRSRKSINRKLEKMREDGVVGFRSKDTIRRSYRQRVRSDTKIEPTKLNDDSFGNGFDTGASAFDNGEGGWDDQVE